MSALISVIIPVRNGSNYLAEALAGIRKQNMPVEIIVADDCSSDNTAALAKQAGCTVLSHEIQKGQIAGKNTGIQAARGEYILFHDHDDIMLDGALQKMYQEFEADPSLSAVEAKVQDWYSPDLSPQEKEKTRIKPEPYWGLFTGAILMKKAVFDTIGLFSENAHSGEIIEWQGKMDAAKLKIKKVDFVSTLRRLHTTNFGKTAQKTEYQNYAAFLRAKLKGFKN